MSIDNEALVRVDAALSLLESLQGLQMQVEQISDTCEATTRTELLVVSKKISMLIQLIDTDNNRTLELIDTFTGRSKNKSKIERLGLSTSILRLYYEESEDIKTIAERFSITEATVKRFIQMYEAAKPVDKLSIRKTSIFDTTNQLETLGAMIMRQLARLELNNPEQHVKYIGEYRQIISMAEKILERTSEQQRIDEIRLIVQEILASELPEKRQLILQRFAEHNLKAKLSSSREI